MGWKGLVAPCDLSPQSIAASKTSSAEPRTCSTSSGSSRSQGCPRCPSSPPPLSSPGSFGGGGALAESPKGLWRWLSILLSLQGPPNFLRASALAEHIKPVVVIPEEAPEDEEPENLIEISSGPPAGEPVVSAPVSPCPTVSPREEEGSPTHAGQSLGFAPPRGLPHHGGHRSVGQRSVFSTVAGGG